MIAAQEQEKKPSLQSSHPVSLWELGKLFLKIGSVAFGGFLSLISVIETECVARRQLLSQEEMLNGITLAQLLPGPMAVNVVAYVGYRTRGIAGAFVSASAVLLPSFLLLLLLSHLYLRYGQIEVMEKLFRGFLPAVAAVVLSVFFRMARKQLDGTCAWIIAGIAALCLFLSPPGLRLYVSLFLIAAGGIAGRCLFLSLLTETKKQTRFSLRSLIPFLPLAVLPLFPFLPETVFQKGLSGLCLTLSGLSVLLFGGGYVFIPMIGDVLVAQREWVSEQEFLDAIAMGQMTPGPILISAAFFGFKMAGIWGALLATAAMFTPPAILMLLSTRLLDFFQHSPAFAAVLRGIRLVVVGMLFAASFSILQTTLPLPAAFSTWAPSLFLFAVSWIALTHFKQDIIRVVPVAGLSGYFLY